MQRSLYSGVTGLTNHQLILDTTANNLANISTNGFKSSRISFSTALLQTQNAGSSPTGSAGGINPRQVGLGVRNSSVDVDIRQGALLSTGRTLDLAIQGNGFFRMSGADGTSAYTRVGNFGFDSLDNLVDLGTGMFVQGRKLDSIGTPTGDRVDVNLANNKSIDAKATTEITFQGNLSATAAALRGPSLSTVLPLTLSATGGVAVEASLLKDTTAFTGPAIQPQVIGDPGFPATKTIYVFGTKPDGTAWAGNFTLNPWQNTVQDLMTKINNVLVQGSETFGTARIENGNLVATGSGDQRGFSLFLGEKDPIGPATATTPVGFTGTTTPAYTAGTTLTVDTATVAAGEAGLINPTFTVNNPPTANVNIKVKVTSSGTTREVGTITIPAGSAAASTWSLASLPHIKNGDVVTYELASTANLAASDIGYATSTVLDSSPVNILRDAYNGTGATADGLPDLFQENSTTDVNAYVYAQATNATMDWYKLRFVPEKVTSSVQVYDSVGGSHTLEARFFRTGTRSVTTGSQTVRYNSWDMVLNVPASEGKLYDPLVVGIEFDEKGRFVGNGRLGSTVHGSTLSDPNTYKGTPSDNTIQMKWGATGDATIALNLGDSSSTNGLTGFGSASTATAVDQNGYGSGALDSLSVTNSGQVVGLYTNGKSLKLYELEIDTFRNPAGLTSIGQNLWGVSANSGDPLARTAGQGGAGSITSGALEGSNVDIASEFTRLITAQRGFQVNSRVIQTTDSILQELAGLIRG